MKDWINVKYRLPEIKDEVLAYTQEDGIIIDDYHKIKGWTIERQFTHVKVLYWMELPKQPF